MTAFNANLIDYNLFVRDGSNKYVKHSIMINSKCNYNCIYCLAEYKKERYSENPAEVYKKIENCGDNSFVFFNSYGEATLSPNLLDYIKYAKSKHKFKYIGLATNGFFLSDKSYAENLLKSGITNILFSFYSSNPIIYEKTCGRKGAYYKSLKALENLRRLKKKYKFHITINTVVTTINYKFLPQTVYFLKNYNVDRIRLTKFVPVGMASKNFEKLIAKESIRKYLKDTINAAKKSNIELKMQFPLKDVDFLKTPYRFLTPFSETLQVWTIHCASSFCPNYKNFIPKINGKCRECSLSILCVNYSNLLKMGKNERNRITQKNGNIVKIDETHAYRYNRSLPELIKNFKKCKVVLELKDLRTINSKTTVKLINDTIDDLDKHKIKVFSSIPYCYLKRNKSTYFHYRKSINTGEMKRAINGLFFTSTITGTGCKDCPHFNKCAGIPLNYFYFLGFPKKFGNYETFVSYRHQTKHCEHNL